MAHINIRSSRNKEMELSLFLKENDIDILTLNETWLKGYFHYKTILCDKVAFDVQLMNFFIWRKNNVSFLRYRDFCVFVKFANFKICDIIISIAA